MKSRQRALLTLAACFAAVFLAPVNSSHGALLSGMIAHFHLADFQQGYPNAAQNIGCLISMFTSLWVIGRISKQKLLTGSIALMALLMLPLSLLPSFPVYLGLYALVGAAFAYIDAIASSMIADLYPGEKASRMMCLMHACHGLAGIVSPLLLRAALGANSDMPRAYLAILAIGVLSLAVIAPINFKVRLPGASERTEPLTLSQLREFFRSRTLRALLFAILFYGFHLVGMIVWVSRYVEVGLGSALGPLALALLYAGITASRLIVSAMKLSPAAYMRWSSLIAGAALAVGLASGNAYAMCACVLVCALVGGSLLPVAIGTACSEFSSNTLLASTLMNLFMLVGNVFASPLIGFVEARAGLTWGMSLCAVAIALTGVSASFMRGARKPVQA